MGTEACEARSSIGPFWRKVLRGLKAIPGVVLAGSVTASDNPGFENVVGAEAPRLGEPTPKSKK